MKNLFTISALALGLATPAFAQPLQVSPAQLSFGTVNELTTDSLQLTLTNPHSFPVQVTEVKFFNTYRQPAFSVAQGAFSVPAGGTEQIWVRFHPEHNIAHNSEMVLVTSSNLGSVSVDLQGQGTYSNSYYSTTQNQKEQALKVALKTKISGHNSLGYNTARDRMFMQIDNKKVNGQGAAVNTLECVYTTRQIVGYTSRSQAQNSPHNFNTEHTFPQGLFNEGEPMKSDLHHLYPTDANANSSRSNMPFGIAAQPYIAESTNNPSHKGTNGYYEPHDGQKGATARAMMYFVTRYQDYSNFFNIQQPALRDWHFTFAPDLEEITRNNAIAQSSNQGNRNPFIDYPQFADRITTLVGTSAEAPVFSLYSSDEVIDFGNPAITQPVYRYVIVNNGNQELILQNLSLSNTTDFSPVNWANNVALLPGESFPVDIQLTLASGDSANGFFSFSTNIPSMPNVLVPVVANMLVSSVDVPLQNLHLTVYPNPAVASVTIQPGIAANETFTVSVYNLNGQLVTRLANQQNSAQLQTGNFAAGVYMLQVQSKTGFGVQRLVKLK